MLTREEDMVMTGTRHPFLGKYKVGFTDEGKLVSLELDMFANAGYSHDLSLAVLERSLTHCDNAYKIPNMKLYGRICKTNTATNTAFRGFGGPQGMMVAEQYITHVADHLKRPVEEIRKLNLYKDREVTHFDMPLENVFLDRAWKELVESSKFEERKFKIKEYNQHHKYRKRGIAVMPTKFGLAFTARFLNQAGSLVMVYTDGSVRITHGGTEMGQGLHTKMLQIAADAFGISLDKVFLSETRTDTVPNTSATAASVSSDINGMAVLNACEQINERLKPLKTANPTFTWEQLIHTAYFERINLSASGFFKTPDLNYDWNTNKGRMFSYFTYGVVCTEVEIDTLTGDHVVLASDIIMDIGRPINPAIDVGQIEGAFVQGLGWCTIEEPLVSPTTGYLLTRGPGMYKIPGFKDIPLDFKITVMDGVRNTRAIHSSKAVGEPPLFLGASCFFALRDAIKSAR
jgi:xanthine dehydrogenase/oxidase